MNNKNEKFYLSLPEFLQNSVISIWGYKEKRLRYSGIYNEYYSSISHNLKKSNREIEQIQIDQLKKVIYKTAGNVPYYRDLFSKIKLPCEEDFRLSDLKMIPILNKEDIRNGPEAFVRTDVNIQKLIELNTTGTTGTPLKVYCNAEVRQKNYAFFSRFLKSVGINPYGSRATIGSRLIVKAEQSKPPFWRYSIFQKSLLLSSYHLSDHNIESYIEILKKYKPSYIDTFPSSIYIIADFASRKKIPLKGITRAIVTSAETLYPYQRRKVEEAFGVPVYDQYGAVEMCVFISQCKYGKYHLNSDYSFVELLNENGCSAGPDEEAEIICTGFINNIMPLVRYKIGDKVELPSHMRQHCDCGSNFPVIKRVLGRADDIIRTPDGRKIGRLSAVFRGLPVREAQFRQYKPDEIEMIIVKDNQYDTETESKLIKELQKRTGQSISVKVKYADKIERGKGGKMRLVISFL